MLLEKLIFKLVCLDCLVAYLLCPKGWAGEGVVAVDVDIRVVICAHEEVADNWQCHHRTLASATQVYLLILASDP